MLMPDDLTVKMTVKRHGVEEFSTRNNELLTRLIIEWEWPLSLGRPR